MIQFPNAKINLGLHVTSKRADGFHNIETVFYPIQWQDILEITPNIQGKTKIEFTATGIPINGNSENNLCVKAYQVLDAEFSLPPVRMHLHKIIPMGAGLGGGSANAAFTLKILSAIFQLNLTDEALRKYASKIGSDCAFFILNKPIYANEKGDVFSDITICLKNYWVLIVKPNINVITKDAYAGITPTTPAQKLTEVLKLNPSFWEGNLVNDFEKSIFYKYPEIKNCKTELSKCGALYTSMSGSGSAVFGIFKDEPDIPYFKDCIIRKEKLLF